MFGSVLRCNLVALTIIASPATASSAHADDASPIVQLVGSWNGSGSVRFEGGQTERLTCRGYYSNRDNGIGIALRCASSSAKIDLRSTLSYHSGQISGSWEERTFNASGDVSGRAANGSMNLAIHGGGLSGSMSISFTGSSQSVSITTSGTGLKGVSITLRRG